MKLARVLRYEALLCRLVLAVRVSIVMFNIYYSTHRLTSSNDHLVFQKPCVSARRCTWSHMVCRTSYTPTVTSTRVLVVPFTKQSCPLPTRHAWLRFLYMIRVSTRPYAMDSRDESRDSRCWTAPSLCMEVQYCKEYTRIGRDCMRSRVKHHTLHDVSN